jgi:hypothetical protein
MNLKEHYKQLISEKVRKSIEQERARLETRLAAAEKKYDESKLRPEDQNIALSHDTPFKKTQQRYIGGIVRNETAKRQMQRLMGAVEATRDIKRPQSQRLKHDFVPTAVSRGYMGTMNRLKKLNP